MSDRVFTLAETMDADSIAEAIGNKWHTLKSARNPQEDLWSEQRDYVFATDTTHTSSMHNDWSNTTTVPKLCQIRDNLHANYKSTLFDNSQWFVWEAGEDFSAKKDIRTAITRYVAQKLQDSGFYQTAERLIYDYIDYGNAFADVEYVLEQYEDRDGVVRTNYVGAKLRRISPEDIVFDVTASEFKSAYKVVREIYTLGDLRKLADTRPNNPHYRAAYEKAMANRSFTSGLSGDDYNEDRSLQIDGFGTYLQYMESGYVEVLRFEGDIYVPDEGELLTNQRIYVVDRSHEVYRESMDSWAGGGSRIHHVGWRLRPDNLWAMSPLENLVGMQYRIDHLQNLKSDVMDLTVAPPIEVKGTEVEDFVYQPFEKIYVGDDGSVELKSPSADAMRVDLEIDWLEQKMEELAGAPKQAMGIRTPGEKTAYEVQTLENAAGRIFQTKIRNLEQHFFEPILNDYLAVGRENFGDEQVERIRSVDETTGLVSFLQVSRKEIATSGVLRPVAARHFAERAQSLQNLTGFANSALAQMPTVAAHFSGKRIAALVEQLLGLEKFDIFQENAGILEQQELQALAQQGELNNMADLQEPTMEEELLAAQAGPQPEELL